MNSPTKPLSAFYGRVSTDLQENSLETQLTRARAYCLSKNLEIPDVLVFSDSDTSGGLPLLEREGGQLLVNTLKLMPAVKNLVVTKVDRLGRSMLDLERSIQTFKTRGITLHFVDFGGDSLTTAGLAGDLVLRILAAVAEFERGMIRSRAKDVLDHKRAKGESTGTCPFGFNLVLTGAINPKTGKPLSRLEPNHEEQKWIFEMHKWRAQFQMSYAKIAAELNRMGVRTKTNKGLWQSGNVAGVLESRYTHELLANHQQQSKAA